MSMSLSTRPAHPHRRWISLLLIALPAVLWLQVCAAHGAPSPQRVTVRSVVQMTREGLPANEIIERMRASDSVYRLKASQLARLREKGVSNRVIDYMLKTYLAAVRRRQALMDDSYGTFGFDDGYGYDGGWPFYGDDQPDVVDNGDFDRYHVDRDHFNDEAFAARVPDHEGFGRERAERGDFDAH